MEKPTPDHTQDQTANSSEQKAALPPAPSPELRSVNDLLTTEQQTELTAELMAMAAVRRRGLSMLFGTPVY